MKSWIKTFLILMVIFSFQGSQVHALKMTPRTVGKVKKIIVRILTIMIGVRKPTSSEFSFVVDGKSFNGFRVFRGEAHFKGMVSRIKEGLKNRNLTFKGIKNAIEIDAHGTIKDKDVQTFLNRMIRKTRKSKRIFDHLEIKFKKEHITASGTIRLDKIPGGLFKMMGAKKPVPFNAQFKIFREKSRIMLEIIEGNYGNQPVTSDLISQMHTWINPLWDFSKADFKADLQKLEFLPGQLNFGGTMFK